jgi:hypothetical protein
MEDSKETKEYEKMELANSEYEKERDIQSLDSKDRLLGRLLVGGVFKK